MASGTVRYYDPATNDWYETRITRITKVDSQSFAYYYFNKNGIEIQVNTNLSWLTIDDQCERWFDAA